VHRPSITLGLLLVAAASPSGCSHALGGGVTGGLSTRGALLVDVEGQAGIAGRLGRREGTDVPSGFWSAGLSPGLGLVRDADGARFGGSFGAHVAFDRYVGPHAFATMLVVGMRFGEVDFQRVAPFFVRLRVGTELELGDPEEVSRPLGHSGHPEYFFHHPSKSGSRWCRWAAMRLHSSGCISELSRLENSSNSMSARRNSSGTRCFSVRKKAAGRSADGRPPAIPRVPPVCSSRTLGMSGPSLTKPACLYKPCAHG
jgi:hypothetical protein